VKRLLKPKFLIVLALLGAGGGGFAYLQYSSAQAAAAHGEEKPKEHAHPKQGVMLPLDDRVINLRPSSIWKYVKVGVTVELKPEHEEYYELTGEARAKAEKHELAALARNKPMLMDALGRVVAAADPAALLTPAGRAQLKADLLKDMRHVVGEEEVLDVYLTNLVMQ
jgi:flagellar basal body-associated protein FliL